MRVTWEYDAADGLSPEDAAVDAFFAMHRRTPVGIRVTVVDAEGKSHSIDLAKLWLNAEALQRARSRARKETAYYLAFATKPHLPPVQASGPLWSRQKFDEMYKEARELLPLSTRFFRVEINPLSVQVYGYAARETTP